MTLDDLSRRVRLVEPTARLRSDAGEAWRIQTADGRILGQGVDSRRAWANAFVATCRKNRAKPSPGFLVEVPVDHPIAVGLDVGSTREISAEVEVHIDEAGRCRILSINRLEPVRAAQSLKGPTQ